MTDPHHVETRDDPRLPALMDWRQQLIDSGAVSRPSFKEAHLRLVLRSGRTDVDQVRAMLPGSVAEHAEDMARVLAELEPKGQNRRATTGDADTADRRLGPMTLSSNAKTRGGDFAPFTFGAQPGEGARHRAAAAP